MQMTETIDEEDPVLESSRSTADTKSRLVSIQVQARRLQLISSQFEQAKNAPSG